MANIDRVRVSLTGFGGAPGVATYYGLSGPALFPSVVALWGGLAELMPASVSIKTENSGDTLNDATGDLVGSWSIAPTTGVVGVSTDVYAAPSGAAITWLTQTITAGRRLKGRTFVVPLAGTNYQNDGTLNAAAIVAILNRAQMFVDAQVGNAVVWHRPFAGSAATATRPARPATVGSNGVITACRVTDKVAILTSRRD